MKKIIITASHPGAGKTTLAVNLASGLVNKGYRVLIAAGEKNNKLYDYLQVTQHSASGYLEAKQDVIQTSPMGMDIVNIAHGQYMSDENDANYDILLLIPGNQSECGLIIDRYDHLLVCTDFSGEKEIEELAALENELQRLSAKNRSISLIVPNQMNSKEWAHNSQELFALADYFGAEKIADPIPACERVHDLLHLRKTVWQINRQNLQDAFDRLIEAVENLMMWS